MGAHCNCREHGQCRINKALRRFPLGYFIAWLQRVHDPSLPKLDTRQQREEYSVWLCSEAGLDARNRARGWLLARHEAFAELIRLEKEFRRAGTFDEPIRIAR